MTVKTAMSRFHIHDELTAPEGSVPILKRVAGGGEVSKFIGVLAGSPTVLRAYARMRSELRDGVLPAATRHRIALAAAERRGDTYGVGTYAKAARAAGLGLDEISKARSFTSADPREAALLTFLEDAIDPGPPELHLLEEAREVAGAGRVREPVRRGRRAPARPQRSAGAALGGVDPKSVYLTTDARTLSVPLKRNAFAVACVRSQRAPCA
jgi:hypothetical protein